MSEGDDTPVMTAFWCPGCDPQRDPSRECLETRWCAPHAPSLLGSHDRFVDFEWTVQPENPSDNRRWCDWLHGRVT